MTADEHAAMVATLVKVAVLQGGQYVVRGVRSLSKEKKLIEERAKHWLIKQHHYRGKGKGTVYYAKSREQRLRGLGTDPEGRPPQAPKAKPPAYRTTPEYKRRVVRGQRLQAAGKKKRLVKSLAKTGVRGARAFSSLPVFAAELAFGMGSSMAESHRKTGKKTALQKVRASKHRAAKAGKPRYGSFDAALKADRESRGGGGFWD